MDAKNDESDLHTSKATIAKPKARKRKEKKEVPLGSNGVRKKRVIKSRMTTDAKGYMGKQ
jgi:DNA polymerase delta subunit 3